jgi:hypothetical protein
MAKILKYFRLLFKRIKRMRRSNMSRKEKIALIEKLKAQRKAHLWD